MQIKQKLSIRRVDVNALEAYRVAVGLTVYTIFVNPTEYCEDPFVSAVYESLPFENPRIVFEGSGDREESIRFALEFIIKRNRLKLVNNND
jgi:hypothetical protein